MLRPLPDLPSGVLGFEAVGEVHSDDYRDVLRPAIDSAAASGGVRLVYVLGPEFDGYSAGAAWQDTELGLSHVSAFERIAVVTDVGWVEHLVNGFGWMVPGELRRFALADRDEAVRWAAGAEADATPEPQPSVATAPEPETAPDPEIASAPASEPSSRPAVAVTQPWAVDPSEADAVAPVPEPVAAAPVAPESFAAVTEPAAVDPVEVETPSTPVSVEPATPITEPQTLTPHAPFAPGADMRPGAATPAPTPPATPSVPEQWAADPTGRHQHRWWNGTVWTEHVADNGVSSVDPLG
jgi:hypothetical protein